MHRLKDKHDLRHASRTSRVHDQHSFVSVTGGTQIVSVALRLLETESGALYNGSTAAMRNRYARVDKAGAH